MFFFVTMFICNLLVPIILIGFGYFMYKYPPKKINGIIGYRTKMSRKSMETWIFAQKYCGRLWLKIGFLMIIPTILVQIPFIHSSVDAIGTATFIIEMVQVAIVLLTIVPVELALRRVFDENGIRK